MARRFAIESGVAVIEAGVICVLTLGLLMAAWGAVDLFQRGTQFEELLERHYYEGLVSAYRYNPDSMRGELTINREALLRYVEDSIGRVYRDLLSQKMREQELFLQGAIIEIVWPNGNLPVIDKISLTPSVGSRPLSEQVRQMIDFHSMALQFIEKLLARSERRDYLVRREFYPRAEVNDSATTERIVLNALAGVIEVPSGPGRLLLERVNHDVVIVRTTYNVLRSDL